MEKLIVSIPNEEMAQKVWNRCGGIREAIYYSGDTRYRIENGKLEGWNSSLNFYENEEEYKHYTFITAEEFLSGSYKTDNKPDVKVGKIYKVKEGSKGNCGNFDDYKGTYIKVTEIDGDGGFIYDILNGDKNRMYTCCWCLHPEDLEEVEEVKEKIKVDNGIIENFYTGRWSRYPLFPIDFGYNTNPTIKKKGIMSNIMQKLKDLTLSETDRLLREEGFEDENGKMTEQARDLMNEKAQQERWDKERESIAENIKKIRESEKK